MQKTKLQINKVIFNLSEIDIFQFYTYINMRFLFLKCYN